MWPATGNLQTSTETIAGSEYSRKQNDLEFFIIERSRQYPIHGQVNPQGVVQLIKQFDKPLLLNRKRHNKQNKPLRNWQPPTDYLVSFDYANLRLDLSRLSWLKFLRSRQGHVKLTDQEQVNSKGFLRVILSSEYLVRIAFFIFSHICGEGTHYS